MKVANKNDIDYISQCSYPIASIHKICIQAQGLESTFLPNELNFSCC